MIDATADESRSFKR